jgi:alkaline phosphatase D
MKFHRLAAGLLFAGLVLLSSVNAGSIVSGPMLGYRAHREVFLWLETQDAQRVALEFWLAGRPETRRTLEQAAPAPTPAGGQIFHFRPGLLEMGATYEYRLSLDGVPQNFPFPTTFSTQALWEWRTPPPDFTFITGSCAYINDPAYDRPGPGYGKTMRTFELMGETDADFMVWLGDNWYYREPDYDSISGLWYRARHDRAPAELRRLLATKHHYATWDDHDYGPNDSNWSYEFKEEALKIFQAYWGNPSYGERDHPGVHTKFTWGDAAFFLMDNHWYRDAAGLDQEVVPEKSQWGRRQLEWLKQSLLQAKELRHFAFKFIATGNQMLQTEPRGEPHELYRREREELLGFIREHRITGVVFLTGDVHHSGLYRRQLGPDGPWVYEITSSPFSSGSWNVETSTKAADPHVVPGTLVGDQNFVTVTVRGPKDARALVITCIDKQGAVRFTQTVPLAELQ